MYPTLNIFLWLKRIRVSILCLMLSVVTGCGFSDWVRNPFGDDEDPRAPAELLDVVSETAINRNWRINVGNGQGDNYKKLTPVVDGGFVFAASDDGEIIAVNTINGDLMWQTEVENSITGGVGAGDGIVMIGTEAAELIVFNQSNGEEVWRASVSSEILSQPKTNGDIVVAQTVDGKLIALNREDGMQRWTYETTLPALTLRGTSSPILTSEGTVVAGFSNGILVSVAAEDGVYVWEERVAVPDGQYDIERVIDVDGELLVDGSRILAASYQGNLMAFDIASGQIVWGMEASSYHGMDQGFGNIYYSDDKSHLIALRNNSSDVVWQNEELQYRDLTAPKTISNYVAIADYEGYLHLVSQIDGRIVGRTRIDNDGIRSNLIDDDGKLIVYGNSGSLVSLTIE
ncbi:MAG: outer membrane protein assembly factor BamB [Gammaproteobacteria bacterium]|jgi:outer membrane protein assembly factor BamB|nr:outer membrane protein assembly factor BamB [Gammaproteobacteria bacterium]